MKYSDLYFGCWRVPGHDFRTPGGGFVPHLGYVGTCQYLGFDQVDGALAPSGEQGEAALLWSPKGWAALAWADRSIDHRGGSNSVVFMFDPSRKMTFADAVARAERVWPSVMERQPVTLWDTAGPRPTSTPTQQSEQEGG